MLALLAAGARKRYHFHVYASILQLLLQFICRNFTHAAMFGLAPEGTFVVSVAQNNSATVTNVVRNALPIVLEHCRPYWAVLERNWLSHRPIGDNDLTQSTDAISVALCRFLLLIQLKLGSKNCIGRSSQYTERCLRRVFLLKFERRLIVVRFSSFGARHVVYIRLKSHVTHHKRAGGAAAYTIQVHTFSSSHDPLSTYTRTWSPLFSAGPTFRSRSRCMCPAEREIR